MSKIVKVLDKGGEKEKDANGKTFTTPRKVLQRYSLDAAEIVASNPDRFELVDDETPHDEDLLGNPVRRGRKKAEAAESDTKGE
jgi:hypothetical protein